MAARSPKTKLGHMACPDCSERVVVKINEHKTLSYACDECDSNGYCKVTEARYPRWQAKISPIAADPPAPAPSPNPPADPKPPAPEKPGLPWMRPK